MTLELTPAVRAVLALAAKPWILQYTAVAWRVKGAQIPETREDEYVFVLHWLLNLALQHGDDWLKEATRILDSNTVRALKLKKGSKL